MRAMRAVAVFAAVLTSLGVLTGPSAADGASSGGGSAVRPLGRECRDRLVAARGGSGVLDPDELTPRQLAQSDSALRRAERRLPSGAGATLAKTRISVDVYVHVLRSKAAGWVARQRIDDQIAVLNDAYAGGQSRVAAGSPFRFRLMDIDVTVNRNWYGMTEGSILETKAKRALHRGGKAALNLYIGNNSSGVLGWGTQPTRLGSEAFMDGVVIARHTMPGGTRGPYSAGDAAVHETGHWLGLFHTFAGRCGNRGDFVKDTPAEARPSYSCPVVRDSCAAKGRDPVHNFMDYSYDGCMDRFTAGQVSRMVRSWNALRASHVLGNTG
jgi:hypothetical protein